LGYNGILDLFEEKGIKYCSKTSNAKLMLSPETHGRDSMLELSLVVYKLHSFLELHE
jgi:hypothetical protein